MTAPTKAQVDGNPSGGEGSGDESGGSGGYGYGGSGGGGGGYSSSTPKNDIKDLNAQLDNAGGLLDLANKSLAKTGKDYLDVIQDQRKANAKQLLMKTNQINRKSEWQPNQQKEQSTYAALRRTMGNAAYGSGLADLNEGMARYDDMQDVSLINSIKENQDSAYNSWYQANSDLIADYNNQVTKTNQEFDSAYQNYLTNITTINSLLGKKALNYADNPTAAAKTAIKKDNNVAAIKAKQQVAALQKQYKAATNKKKQAKLKKQIAAAKKKTKGATAKVSGKSYNLNKKSGKNSMNAYIKALSKKTGTKVNKSTALKKALKAAKKTASNNAKNISQKIDGGKLKTTLRNADEAKASAMKSVGAADYLKPLEDKASKTNPNYGLGNGYFRGDKEDISSANKANESMMQTSSKTASHIQGPQTSNAANEEAFKQEIQPVSSLAKPVVSNTAKTTTTAAKTTTTANANKTKSPSAANKNTSSNNKIQSIAKVAKKNSKNKKKTVAAKKKKKGKIKTLASIVKKAKKKK